jgi:hypothetical protein
MFYIISRREKKGEGKKDRKGQNLTDASHQLAFIARDW